MAVYRLGDKTPNIHPSAYIAETAAVIGDVTIGAGSSVWSSAVIRADNDSITIGENTNIQDGAVLHADPGEPLKIGSDCTIGHQAMLHGCTIGSRVLIGMGAMVMDGAVVEDEVIIGAGSLVPPGKTLESGYLYVGRPVKQQRPLTDKEREFFTYTAGNYVKLKDQHLQQDYASSAK